MTGTCREMVALATAVHPDASISVDSVLKGSRLPNVVLGWPR
jgi:hypothetical protein